MNKKTFIVDYYGIVRHLDVMTADEYIEYHKKNNYINYCEIIILESGNILLAHPSHQGALSAVIKENTGLSLEELSVNYFMEDIKYYSKCVLVYNSYQSVFSESFLTTNQMNTLNLLSEHKAIDLNISYYDDDYVEFYLKQKVVV